MINEITAVVEHSGNQLKPYCDGPHANELSRLESHSQRLLCGRAKGGVGLIMPGAIPVDPFRSHKYVKSIQDWIVDPVHRQGAKIGVQLWHGNLFPCGDPSGTLVAPSAGFRNQGTAEEKYHRELAEEEIRGIISTFVLAAVNAREAGFDMVELHGAHGYLLHQFFSPVDNWRMDGYGGDLRRRMRVGLELAQAVRKAVGDDFPIFFRISAEEMRPGGITLEESIQYAQALETVGIDCIDVSFGPGRGRVDVVPGSDNPEGTFVHMAEKIKKRVHVPVIAVGSIRNPEFAEAILEGQKADLVAMGRQLLADPYWVKKVSEGRNDEIRRCIRCNNCIEQYGMGQPVSCAINASTGREESFFTIPAEQCKRVLVVGGGPAGMEAASVASGRGHKVILAEKSDQLGGQLRAAAAPPHKDEIGGFIDYQIGQLKINGVEIRTGRSVTTADIEELKPQVVVVATGSEPAQTRGPGVGKRVWSTQWTSCSADRPLAKEPSSWEGAWSAVRRRIFWPPEA